MAEIGRPLEHPHFTVLQRGGDLDGGMHGDPAVSLWGVVVVGDTRPDGGDSRRAEAAEQLVVERPDDRADALGQPH